MKSLRVHVFGADGQLGTDLTLLQDPGLTIVPHGRSVDITSREAILHAIGTDAADWVVNAAAYNNVDLAESEQRKAFAVNAAGPGYLAEICNQRNIPLVHVSTDYVFSGKNEAYSENDPPDPISVYGHSKWEGEQAVRRWEKHYVLRTSALYGVTRKNHAIRVMEAMQGGAPVKAATDVLCAPTFTGDLAQWIADLMKRRPPFGTYHLCHDGYCTRYEFAETLCALVRARKPYPIEAVEISALRLPARRPPNVRLSLDKWKRAVGPLPTWRKGIKHFLRALGSFRH